MSEDVLNTDSSLNNTIRFDCEPKDNMCKTPWNTYKACMTRNKSSDGTKLSDQNDIVKQGNDAVNKNELTSVLANLKKVDSTPSALAFKFSHR